MQDESAELLDSNLLRDAESTSQHVAVAPSGDELMTASSPSKRSWAFKRRAD